MLIEGARRIGKSTIAEEFGKNEYESYILLDFNKASKKVKDAFDDSMICNFCYKCNDPNVGFSLNKNESFVKCYMGDTGLLVSHAFNENESKRKFNLRIL